MPSALVLLATGFETIEGLAPVDLLKRAGVDVTLAAIGDSLEVTSAHGVTVKADKLLSAVGATLFDAIVLPGGMPGTTNLAASPAVIGAVKAHANGGKVVAAICAAPGYVLAEAAGILKGKRAAGYPGTDEKITAAGGTKVEEDVVVDGKIITSRGPGTAFAFGLTLVKTLAGDEKATSIGKGTLYVK